MKIIFVLSPYASATEDEMETLKIHCANLIKGGSFPIATHLYFPNFMADTKSNRKLVRHQLAALLNLGIANIGALSFSAHVLGTRMTSGMAEDIELLIQFKVSIKFIEDQDGT